MLLPNLISFETTELTVVPPNETAMPKQPYFVAGAGSLVSHIHRQGSVFEELQYQFNLFRVDSTGNLTSWFRPEDLRDIVKACQVLAFSIADDGWVEDLLCEQLIELASDLQNITDTWSQNDVEIQS